MSGVKACYIQANTDGELHDAQAASIAPLNRGFLYGDAIYEVWRTYNRTIFAWSEHWQRLGASATALGFDLPWSEAEIRRQIARTTAAFGESTGFTGELYVRLQVARGAGAIGLDPSLADAPSFVILVQPVPVLSAETLERGLVLSVAQSLRRNPRETLNPAWKTGNYLNNVLCLREAKRRGADDVVILNLTGNVTEASASNILLVREGRIFTPPLSAGILAGVTRRLIIESIAGAAGIEISELDVAVSDLGSFEECALISTTKDVQPVARIDAHAFSVGTTSVMRTLKEAFAAYAEAYASSVGACRV